MRSLTFLISPLKNYLNDYIEMPDKTLALLMRFLEQGTGVFSERARDNEFRELTAEEIERIEAKYQEVFQS
jgi:hypothetical protein